MHTANIKVKGETLHRLKVLGAQLNKSLEGTVDYLINYHAHVDDECFHMAIDNMREQRGQCHCFNE